MLQGPEFADQELTIVAFDDLKSSGRHRGRHHLRDDGAAASSDGQLSISEPYRILTEGYVPECALLDTGVTVVTKNNLTTYTNIDSPPGSAPRAPRRTLSPP